MCAVITSLFGVPLPAYSTSVKRESGCAQWPSCAEPAPIWAPPAAGWCVVHHGMIMWPRMGSASYQLVEQQNKVCVARYRYIQHPRARASNGHHLLSHA